MSNRSNQSKNKDLLTTVDLARFVARGFLRFDAVIPADLNERFLREVEDGFPPSSPAGTPLSEAYPGSVLREVLSVPVIAGAIESLVGEAPLFDHQGTHFAPSVQPLIDKSRRVVSQHYHQDSTIDPRTAFDIQLFYFPHDVDDTMGGTRFLPGSHLRVVSEAAIGRYQNILGQQKVICSAGTILVMHHGIWHGGELYRSDRTRYMLKVRLNPTVRQCRLWNTDDLSDEMAEPQVIFDFKAMSDPDLSDVQTILCQPEPWFEADTSRLEYINRIRLWRYLLGDDDFDAQHWCTRIENMA